MKNKEIIGKIKSYQTDFSQDWPLKDKFMLSVAFGLILQ